MKNQAELMAESTGRMVVIARGVLVVLWCVLFCLIVAVVYWQQRTPEPIFGRANQHSNESLTDKSGHTGR
jgi:hypothetical protein